MFEVEEKNGLEFLKIHFSDFSVELAGNEKEEPYGRSIYFHAKENGNITKSWASPGFFVTWNMSSDKTQILNLEIKHRDRWGSEMIFRYWAPSDLQGMFKFIAKGYGIDLCTK